jgi:hypothetical protein
MAYADGARYVREKGCLPETRESLLQDICDILNNPDKDAPRVCLLTGMAGSGKSAVAHSIARLYDGLERLGSSYCFSSADVARRNPRNLFSTIARDLSDHDPQYSGALWEIVKDNRALRTSISPDEQIERLIIEPSERLDTIGPLVIVIDALDESGSRSDRGQLLKAISKQISENTLPANLRFLITSRPESDIVDAFSSGSHFVHKKMGDISEEEVDEDIRKFIHHSLDRYTELEARWPKQEWCRLIVHHSQHLFQWASTACRFIQGEGAIGVGPSKRMKMLLEHSKDAIYPLDTLYQTILGQLFMLSQARQSFRDVMAIILALQEPLSLMSLSALLGFDEDFDIREIVKPMGSLLDGVHDEEKPIRPLHSSFRDFLLDEARSSSFHIVIGTHHSLRLGKALVGCMQNMLRFNICDLKNSRIPNKAIPDLSSRVKKAIPPRLIYSCQYWMVHLSNTAPDQELLDTITCFFKKFFPYWLEAISLLASSSPLVFILSAVETCRLLKKWAKVRLSISI